MDRTRPHILVIDDCRDTADSAADLLAAWGHGSRACYDGASGLAAAGCRPPVGVFLDLAMPGIDGFEFAARLRAIPGCAATPVCAISGHAGTAYRSRWRALRVGHYLLKPAPMDRMKALAGLWVRRHARTDLLSSPSRCRGLAAAVHS